MTEQTCKCIACGKQLVNIMEDGTLQPSGGTAFQTQGHYGSHMFDPMDGSVLEIAVCDDCLGIASARGEVVLFENGKARPNPGPKDMVLLLAENDMGSAGAEIMALSHDLAKHPEFKDRADRIRMIGAWASFSRTSDLERALMQTMGEVVQHMRANGVPFDEAQPIADQFKAYIDAVASETSTSTSQPGYAPLRDTLDRIRRVTTRVDVKLEGERKGDWQLVLGGHVKSDGTLMVGADLHVRPDSTLEASGETLVYHANKNADETRQEKFSFGGTSMTLTWSPRERRV